MIQGEKMFLQFVRKVALGGSLTVRGWLFRIAVHLMGGSLGPGAKIYKGGMIIMMTREANIRIGQNLRIRRNAMINTATPKARIEIGDNVWLGESTMVTSGCRIDIEDDVIIGPHTVVCDVDHVVGSDGMPTRALAGRPIRICQGAWIAANCNIVKGVTVGKGAIIGSGSVVTKDIPAYSTAVGVPARVIRER